MKRLSMILGFALCASSALLAAPVRYYADLSGPNENPSNTSPGYGTAYVTVDDVANTLQVEISFFGLEGTTAASHIHCCTVPPGNVGVATQTPSFIGFPLGVTLGTYDETFDMTQASSFRPGFITANGGTVDTARPVLFTGIAAGQAYVNIHTTSYGGGEIRGFLQPVPEPGTLALCSLALGSLIFLRRRA